MKKLMMVLVFLFLILFIGCKEEDKKNDDDQINDNDIVDVDDTENPDEAKDDTETPDDGDCVTLDSDWMQPEDAWTSWAYLKMMGPIGDYDGEYAAAVFTDGKIKLTSGTTDFADGSYMNYQSQILLADAAAYEFTDVDQAAGTAVVDYWDAMYQFSLQLIPLMKEEGATEAGFGATVTFRHTYIDVEFDASGAVTSQQVRKNCYLAVSNTEEMEEEGETYDVPIGDMFGCFGENTDASVGEDLKMMFKNDMTEDQAALLEFFNTQTDGTVLAYGDEGFQHVCMCYEADGTEVDCWAYDGPGDAEECPDYVSEEDCKVPVTDEVTDEVADEMTDEVVVDEAADEMADEMTDEVIVDEMADEMADEVVVDEMADEMTDEVVVDEMVDEADDADIDNTEYVDPCLPVNPCVETNKTVCTDENMDETPECSCDENHHLNGGECLETLSIGWCNTQHPLDISEDQGTSVIVYGTVWVDGITNNTTIVNSTNTSNPNYSQLIAQVGYGDVDTSATTWTTWSANGVPNEDKGNNDEFMMENIVLDMALGNYDFIVRFSGDSGNTWTYCNTTTGTNTEFPYTYEKNGTMEILEPTTCGNSQCDPEDEIDCPEECCGNGTCDDWEDEMTCPPDCAPMTCGNGMCDPEDEMYCPEECEMGICGNGMCDPGDEFSCPEECEMFDCNYNFICDEFETPECEDCW